MLNDEIKLFPNISRDACVSTAYAVVRYPSVSLSVCGMSRSCIVSKLVNIGLCSNFFNHSIATPF